MMQTNMQRRYENARIVESDGVNALAGGVVWSPTKSVWITSMYVGAILAATVFFSWSGVLIFLGLSALTLCAGHSVGMHRRLIHRSFECPLWLERTMVYLGTLVGLGGPITMTYTHDLRDWAQRQRDCHDYFGHRKPLLVDAFWQLHCDVILQNPPQFSPEQSLGESRFYRFIERTSMVQQIPWALALLWIGGISWVVWGICARVTVSMTGHWLIGYFAHNHGGQTWRVARAAVQGFDVKHCGLITFGECWHNNHHAFPRSARIGLYAHQTDPGWIFIRALELLGLAWNIQTPETLPDRPELVPVVATAWTGT